MSAKELGAHSIAADYGRGGVEDEDLASHLSAAGAVLGFEGNVEIRRNAGGGKGRGLFATKSFSRCDVVFEDDPIIGLQHTDNKSEAWACDRCLRTLGSLEEKRRYLASRREGSCGASTSNGPPSFQCVSCRGGCEETYCSERCESEAWRRYHHLLCPASTKASAACAADLLSEFGVHADTTNDIFKLAARFFALLLTLAARNDDGARLSALDRTHLNTIKYAWKLPWWRQVALPEDIPSEGEGEFRSQLRHLCEDSFDLLKRALAQRVPERFGAHESDLHLYASLIGMFELNNLGICVDESVQGTGFFPTHSLLNHSCDPNILMCFDRLEDEDGSDDDDGDGGGDDGSDDDGGDGGGDDGDWFESSRCFAYALKDIVSGEELTCSYLTEEDLQLTTAERRTLLRDYGFVCMCPRCASNE